MCAPAARVSQGCCGIVRLGPSTHATNRRLLPAFGRSTQEDSDRLNKADNQDGQDEEGQGAPLVQGGEGQGAQEVLRAHRCDDLIRLFF